MSEAASQLRRALERLGLPGPGEPLPAGEISFAPPAPPSIARYQRRHDVALVTRCTRDHLPYARVLAESLARHQPDLDLYVVVADLDPGEIRNDGGSELLDLDPGERNEQPQIEDRKQTGPDRHPGEGRGPVSSPLLSLIPAAALGIDKLAFLRLALSPAQLCMALKPAACRFLATLGYAKVLSFDADIEVCSPLDALLQAPGTWVVTPHLQAPLPDPERTWEHPTLAEIASAGRLNNGLFAFVPNARSLAFLDQWENMVMAPGAFLEHQAEQNAFDWLVSFAGAEDVTVLRDRGYNVAYWNLHDRSLRWSALDGGDPESFTVDGAPLVAFHWSGLPPDDRWRLSVHDHRHSLHLLPSIAALADRYRARLASHGLEAARRQPYRYGRFAGGLAIDARMRRVFLRHELLLADGPDPFAPASEEPYCRALLRPAPGSFLVPALLWEVYRERPDIQVAFPEARSAPRQLIEWFCAEGADELGYAALLDRYRPTLPRREPILHLQALVEEAPELYGDLAAPLGADRAAFVARLTAAGRFSEARGVRGLDPEIWAPCAIAAVRKLVRSRPDLATTFPDCLGADAEHLAAWLEGDGVELQGLPPGLGDIFRRKAGGRALGRIYSFYRRHPWLQERYPRAFVGDGSEALAAAMLERWPADCEFDLDDVAMFQWEMAERPWRGVGAILASPLFARRAPSPLSPEGEALLLGPLLARPGFAAALADWRARPAPPGGATRGVNCFGYFKSPIGLGTLSRGLALALETAGFAVARQLTGIMEMAPDLRLEDFLGTFREDYGANVFVSFPHLHAPLLESQPREWIEGRRQVVYLAWEQRDGHPWWRERYAGFDQIWALSRFAAEAIGRATGRDVLAVPAAIDFAALPPAATPEEAELDPERCTFLYVFDANSSLERKNPEAAIAAFARAFAPGDKVELLLKVSHGGRFEHRRQLARLAAMAAATGLPIRFETRHLARRDLMRLISAAGAYVSLHRAEGFGYTCAEAMAYGVPVIATGYSGNLDFMDEASAHLVRWKEVEVAKPDGPFQRGSVWAEPDVDHAASLMRQIYENRKAARELGARGAAYVREKLALERIAAIVGDALGHEGPKASQLPLRPKAAQ